MPINLKNRTGGGYIRIFNPSAAAPSIVTDGLVLNLDASNASSYPGSGTTWYDLSGNGYDGTLINSPTYSSLNGGYLIFNGSNQRVANSTLSNITGNTYRTMGGWIKGTTSENIPFALGNSPAYNAPNKGFGVNLSSTTTVAVYGISGYYDETGITASGLLSGNWSYLTITWDGTSIRVYCNGTLTGTRVRSSGAYDSLPGYFVGTWTNLDRFYNGYISTFSAYNRALSDSEILQNYNVQKTRFGL